VAASQISLACQFGTTFVGCCIEKQREIYLSGGAARLPLVGLDHFQRKGE
jgi:hypothetical protein